MNRNSLNIVLTTIGLCVLAGYLTWSVFMLRDTRDDQPCNNVRVYVADSASRHFIMPNEIISMLRQNDLYPNGVVIRDLDAMAIEELIGSHNLLRSAECYTTPAGDMVLALRQKEPKFRVMGVNGDYFVDTERTPMKVTSRTASYVPVVTGTLTQELATTEIYDFVDFIEHDSFWKNQIEQIIVVGNRTVKLIPRIGSHTIILGTLERYEQKLEKLETLYTKGFNEKLGWKNYKEIDLRYDGQIVCR